MTSELNTIISNLVINHENIEKNLHDAKNKSISQKFLSHLVNSGIDRDTAYRKIQDQIFEDTPLNELKEVLEFEFNVKFPDLDNDVQKNVDQNKFKDKFQ
jgi:adenylosuccinate lyase